MFSVVYRWMLLPAQLSHGKRDAAVNTSWESVYKNTHYRPTLAATTKSKEISIYSPPSLKETGKQAVTSEGLSKVYTTNSERTEPKIVHLNLAGLVVLRRTLQERIKAAIKALVGIDRRAK